MDPIKVDFSKKGGGKKEIVIPPEKAALKIVISIIGTIVAAVIAFYAMLPAINFKSYDFYIYLGIIVIAYAVLSAVLTGVFSKPEYMPYFKRQMIVPVVLIAVLVVVMGIGYLVSSPFFRAEAYSNIIDVRTDSNFAEEIDQQDAESFSNIPKLDEGVAATLAPRALGNLAEKGYVSQFSVYPLYTQINYKGTPVRVVPLQYSNIIKWFTNRSEGLPGYIVIDMANEVTTFQELENGIKYSPSEHFGRLLERHLRMSYPTYLFGDASFEIDDEGNPYWICARLDKTIGLFGGTDVVGIVIVDADDEDGKTTYVPIDEVKNDPQYQWIDRVYDSDLLVEQYNYYGRYQKGFWNSILGQEDVYVTTEDYSYIAQDDDVYMYTGVTSVTSDQSITGFVLINQRTKESVYYSVPGAKEQSAQASAEGLDEIKAAGYQSTFPLLLNIGGEPTYFMALKDVRADGSQIIQSYALINVKQYTKIKVYGKTLSDCLAKYIAQLEANGIKVDIDADEVVDPSTQDGNNENAGTQVEVKTATGKIEDIRTQVVAGETCYYIKLAGSDIYYSISASKSEAAVILNMNDTVTIKYVVKEGAIIPANEIEKTVAD
ncbi:MAG: CvpA family protein [Clostridia bacterium]|nr:CvpA family protein [Clostridia bacterium]